MQEIIKNFENNGFCVKYFETKQDACDYLVSTIENKTITFGGSVTLDELGLYNKLSINNTLFDHSVDGKFHQTPDVYFSSANALTKTGEIINIDGRGNRVSATIYGPKAVYIICGVNKIEDTLHNALYRAQNVAAPLNARRLNRKTPCAQGEMKCHNCNSTERICASTVIMNKKSRGIEHFEIVLINDSLGY